MRFKARIIEVGSDGHHPRATFHIPEIDNLRGLASILYEHVEVEVLPEGTDKEADAAHAGLDSRGALRKDEDGKPYTIIERMRNLERMQEPLECPGEDLVTKPEAIIAGLENQVELLREDLECVHIYLDVIDAPRKDPEGRDYSIVGRIKAFVLHDPEAQT